MEYLCSKDCSIIARLILGSITSMKEKIRLHIKEWNSFPFRNGTHWQFLAYVNLHSHKDSNKIGDMGCKFLTRVSFPCLSELGLSKQNDTKGTTKLQHMAPAIFRRWSQRLWRVFTWVITRLVVRALGGLWGQIGQTYYSCRWVRHNWCRIKQYSNWVTDLFGHGWSKAAQ